MDINTFICCGGGVKIYSIIGSLLEIENNFPHFFINLKKYAGSSSGSIIVSLLLLGYTPNEIYNIFYNLDTNSIYDSFFPIVYNMYKNYGIFSGNNLINKISDLFLKKGYSKDITFKQLFDKTKKILVITGTCLNTRNTFYFNYETYPNIKVIDAIRISCSIPLFFTSPIININNKEYRFVDGGLLNNFPIYYFDVKTENNILTKNSYEYLTYKNNFSCLKLNNDYLKNTLGILLINNDTEPNVDDYFIGYDTIDSILTFINSIINTIFTKLEESNFNDPITGSKENYFNRTITIKTPSDISVISFDITQKQKDILIENGKKYTKIYLQNNI